MFISVDFNLTHINVNVNDRKFLSEFAVEGFNHKLRVICLGKPSYLGGYRDYRKDF